VAAAAAALSSQHAAELTQARSESEAFRAAAEALRTDAEALRQRVTAAEAEAAALRGQLSAAQVERRDARWCTIAVWRHIHAKSIAPRVVCIHVHSLSRVTKLLGVVSVLPLYA
jgi:hypothetical protein